MSRLQTYYMADSLEAFRKGGHQELLEIARQYSVEGVHDGMNPTSREDVSAGPLELPVLVVSPKVLAEHAPWLEDWYRGPLLERARDFAGPAVVASENPDSFPLINTHRGWNERLQEGEIYECHTDSNYPTGLYYLGTADRSTATGGALAISEAGDVPTRDRVLENCTRYYPKIGQLAVMNGYRTSHFVEQSIDQQDRIMLVCNFWTPEVPEVRRTMGLADYQLGARQA